MFPPIAIKLVIAVLLGAAVGLERESSSKGETSGSGIRTFTLISLLGALCGMLYLNPSTSVLGISFMVAFFAILLVYYVAGSFITKIFGMTTELAKLFTFLLGLLCVLDIVPLQFIIALFVVLVLVLSLKARTQNLIAGIKFKEIESFISYAIVALVILPFLPNFGYTVKDIPLLSSILESLGIGLGQFAGLELLNPQKVWYVVALITGIDVAGYVVTRVTGNKKSFTLTSFAAGFISSTSTTQSLAQKSKKSSNTNHLVGAAILANMASFLQMFVLVGPLNGRFLIAIMPSLLIMVVSATVIAIFFLRKKEDEKKDELDQKEQKIFSLMPALKFAAMLVIIKIITKICLIVFGKGGFIVSSLVASFAGIDAIVVNISEMAGTTLVFQFAVFTFLLVSATNLFSKSIYSFIQGSRGFAVKFFVSVLIINALSFLGLFLVI